MCSVWGCHESVKCRVGSGQLFCFLVLTSTSPVPLLAFACFCLLEMPLPSCTLNLSGLFQRYRIQGLVLNPSPAVSGLNFSLGPAEYWPSFVSYCPDFFIYLCTATACPHTGCLLGHGFSPNAAECPSHGGH